MNPVLGFTSAISNVESIPMLNGSNFSEWKEHLLLVLALMDLDISLREERPDAFEHTDETKHWDRSNRMSLMIMRIRIPQKLRGVVPEDVTTAKEYLAAVEKCYAKNESSEMDMVLTEFSSLRKKPDESVREYIMTKMSLAAKMKKLGMHVPDDLVASVILDSLPSEYYPLKRTYSLPSWILISRSGKSVQMLLSTLMKPSIEKWSTHELISHCVQEEDTLKLFYGTYKRND